MTITLQYPPTDGSITVLPGLADFQAQYNPDRPWAIYPLSDSALSSIPWLEFAKATHRIAHWLRPYEEGMKREVVGMIIHCDTILYVTLLVAIARAGLVVRTLSMHCSGRLKLTLFSALPDLPEKFTRSGRKLASEELLHYCSHAAVAQASPLSSPDGGLRRWVVREGT